MDNVRKPGPEGSGLAGDVIVVDPVCGMPFERRHAAAEAEVDGRTYHFCSLSCARQFERDVPAYVSRDAGEVAP